jgi:hypothetical protein
MEFCGFRLVALALCLRAVSYFDAVSAVRLKGIGSTLTPSCPTVSTPTPGVLSRGYFLTYVDDPAGSSSSVQSVNNNGVAAGIYSDADTEIPAGFIASPPYKTASDFVHVIYPGAQTTSLLSINSKNIAVGSITVSNSNTYGFIKNATGIYYYKNPRAAPPAQNAFQQPTATYFTSINDNNIVVGYYLDATTGKLEGFSYSIPKVTWSPIISGYSGISVQPTGINNNGEIVGSATCSLNGNIYGFFFNPTTLFTYFSIYGSVQTVPNAVNNKGEIAGTYVRGNTFTGFVAANVNGGTLLAQQYNVPGSQPGSTTIYDITDSGALAGSYLDSSDVMHGFIAPVKPPPPPPSPPPRPPPTRPPPAKKPPPPKKP